MMDNDISWHVFSIEPPPFFQSLLLLAGQRLYFGWWSSKHMGFFGWTQDDYYANKTQSATRIENVITWAEIPEDYNRL
jgi:hypothetical protein